MSPASYLRVDYTIRPAKSIERRMIAEASGRLRAFFALDAYRYIGFGSLYFTDFLLMHRRLGVADMISIEMDESAPERFRFNKPLDCIRLEFGKSTRVLPTLEWADRPSIVWLDYDGKLDEDVLADISVVFGQIAPGSLAFLTVRARAQDFGDKETERLVNLKQSLNDRLPTNAGLVDVSQARFPGLLWRIIDSEIRHTVTERNPGLHSGTEFEYSQTFHFRYRDSVPMLTVGGLVYQAGQRSTLSQCDMRSLTFAKEGAEPYEIIEPKLTYKERVALNEQLPGGDPAIPGVPEHDVEAYTANYRYFPFFVETEM